MDAPTDGGLASAVLLAAAPPAARLDRGVAGALYGGALGLALKLAAGGGGGGGSDAAVAAASNVTAEDR